MCNFIKISDEKNLENKLNNIYFKSIKKIQTTDEYKQNNSQIYALRKIIIENCWVPETLVDWLIESVAENTALEYESANRKINKHFIL